MKGVYSSPDSIRHYATERALFPDNAYRFSSGGDPLAIPRLTYESFIAFHRKYYVPWNARIFFFGDDDPLKRLEIAHEYLDSKKNLKSSTSILMASSNKLTNLSDKEILEAGANTFQEAINWPQDSFTVLPQPLWNTPRTIKEPYPSSAARSNDDVNDENIEGKEAAEGTSSSLNVSGVPDEHDVTVSWVMHEKPLDEQTRIGLAVLSYLLMRTQTSTLYKALTDSALGSTVIGGGLDGEYNSFLKK
jgi:presequence protease